MTHETSFVSLDMNQYTQLGANQLSNQTKQLMTDGQLCKNKVQVKHYNTFPFFMSINNRLDSSTGRLRHGDGGGLKPFNSSGR